ncbi:MAG TPA: ABC transporter permease, partial [Gemmatimonas sp.]|nr:ABC transporter permease [Gemmatimonas sp.]
THDFVVWRKELRTITDVGAFRTVGRNLVTGGAPEPVPVAEMSAAGFTLARTAPLFGRTLVDADEAAGAQPVVVIGHKVWKERFASDPSVVGRTLRLNATTHTIVGVMPDRFLFPENHEYWIPLRSDPTLYPRGKGPEIYIFGRLAPGISMEAAQAELTVLGKRAAADFPRSNGTIRPMVMPYTHSITDVQGTTLWMAVQMQAMMTLLLVIVAFNVAVLVYARTATRQGEIAVRSALGASRGRIVWQLFMEGLVLSVLSALAGLLIANVGIRLASGIMEAEMGTPFWLDYGMRPRTVLFAIGVTVFSAVIVGVLPALQATGRRLQDTLRSMSSGTGVQLGRTWTFLIVAQVAIAAAALPAAVSAGWGELRGAVTKPIYDPTRFLLTNYRTEAGVGSALTATDSVTQRREATVRLGQNIQALVQRIEAEPGVLGVSYNVDVEGRRGRMEVEGVTMPEKLRGPYSIAPQGSEPKTLSTMGARVLTGREFDASDMDTTSGSVIVNAAFVRQILGDAPPLGKRIRYAGDEARGEDAAVAPSRWFTIIGVTEDVETNRFDPDLVAPRVYYPAPLGTAMNVELLVHTRDKATDFAPQLRKLAVEVDPTLLMGRSYGLDEFERQNQLAVRLGALMIGLVLLSVSLLSAAGVYALTSFTVTRRRREIGIRTALGAQPGQVLRALFKRVAVQIAIGLAVGIGSAAALELATGGEILQGRGGYLLPAFGVLMAVVSALAALGPARRGLRVQPAEALRADG